MTNGDARPNGVVKQDYKSEQGLQRERLSHDGEYDFYELDLGDLIHLNRLYNLYGRERVVSWLRGKVALPTRLQIKQYEGEDVDEEAYYQAAADYYLDLDGQEADCDA